MWNHGIAECKHERYCKIGRDRIFSRCGGRVKRHHTRTIRVIRKHQIVNVSAIIKHYHQAQFLNPSQDAGRQFIRPSAFTAYSLTCYAKLFNLCPKWTQKVTKAVWGEKCKNSSNMFSCQISTWPPSRRDRHPVDILSLSRSFLASLELWTLLRPKPNFSLTDDTCKEFAMKGWSWFVQWLRLALCKGPNWVGVSCPLTWRRKQIQFPKRCVLLCF
jgi:hypothetical protein